MRSRATAVLAFALAAVAAACGSSSSSDGNHGSCTLSKTTGSLSTCQNLGHPGTSAAPTAQHLGRLQVGQSATFTVPANTVSVSIVQQAMSAPDSIQYQIPPGAPFTVENFVAPLTLKDPNQTIYNDLGSIPSGADPLPSMLAFSQSPSPGMGTLTIPNTTKALTTLVGTSGLTPGQWTVVVSDLAYECATANLCCSGGSSASSYDLTVITKTGVAGGADPIPSAGRLDLELWFATNIATTSNNTNRMINAAIAANDPDVQRMVQTLRTLLQTNAGITLGNVGYHDAAEQAANPSINVDLTGACSDLSNLFRQSTNGNALNVFFVSSFTAAGLQGQRVVGSDGTIPGPSSVAGSPASGVAVSTEDLRFGGTYDVRSTCPSNGTVTVPSCGADMTAYIIAHELGHYLGLYHTTEGDGTSFDTLSDTPTCPCDTCAPASVRNGTDRTSYCADKTPSTPALTPYSMAISECSASAACGGGNNLMFYVVGQGAQGTLSDQQRRVMHANPLLQ